MVQVTSEIGRLRRALVHEPGREVDRMVPAMMEQLLFDDILYGDRARHEHASFRRVLQLCGVEVLEAAHLLGEALEEPGARDWILEALAEDVRPSYVRRLRELPVSDLVDALVCGVRRREPGMGIEADDLYAVPPLPNWCFQRDTQVVLDEGVVFTSMAAAARYREGLLARVIFRFHPSLRTTPVLFEPSEHVRSQQRPALEGGDVLVLSRELLAVGISERTNRAAVRALARTLAADEGGPRTMLVVQLPRRRAYMHLDTVFTPVARDTCMVYPPVILPGGSETATIWEIDLRSADLEPQRAPHLLDALAGHGIEYEPIPCGGSDTVTQQREQWTDGANALAVAPGVITLYGRNVGTAEELGRRGFRILTAEDLLLGRDELDVDAGELACILIPSNEMSRARGGPHCMVHPLHRDNLS